MDSLLAFLRCKHRLIQQRLINSQMYPVTDEPRIPLAPLPQRLHCKPSRPSLVIDFDEVVFLRSIQFTWVDIAHMYGVSPTTIYRKCKEAGILDLEKQRVFSYQDLLPVVNEIKQEFPI